MHNHVRVMYSEQTRRQKVLRRIYEYACTDTRSHLDACLLCDDSVTSFFVYSVNILCITESRALSLRNERNHLLCIYSRNKT